MAIQPGLSAELNLIVQDADTAAFSAGPHLPEVLSTPRMIGMMERAAHQAVQPLLEEGQGTVGTMVNVRHLAATPVGMQVKFLAELVEVDGKRLRFQVTAWDEKEKIGEGEHERYIINRSKFDQRLQEKNTRPT